ncbi:MAG: hypothetical protein CME18_02215 [Gemmatimonadetes bacterium]|nr:hypothetical protein [Gemmatimonadota bacterium]
MVPLTMRRLRLKTVWLAVFPFLWMASPDMVSLLLGAGLALPGLWIRGWSAGTIHKDKKIAMTGPYALTRNPLYLGSFCIGLGVALAGGQGFWFLAFLAFYIAIYSKTMEREVRHLTELFPDVYSEYASSVPMFFPRITVWSSRNEMDFGGFCWSQYHRNKEWEASVGVISVFMVLCAKVLWAL